jgi:trehalose synthase
MHDALQGASVALTPEQEATYLANTERNARRMEEEYDFVVVHDPQPAGLPAVRGRGAARWIWRCHIDTSAPNPEVWRFLRSSFAAYDAAIFTMPEFVPADLPIKRVDIVPPAIDPLSPKNLALPVDLARAVLDWIGVELGQHPARPSTSSRLHSGSVSGSPWLSACCQRGCQRNKRSPS